MNRQRLCGGALAVSLAALGGQAGCAGSSGSGAGSGATSASSSGNAAGAGGASASGTSGAGHASSASGTSNAASTASSATSSSGGGGAAGSGTGGAAGLNPNVAPGGNFDLSLWELQEPVGSPGAPKTILPAALVGPNGYHDSYFFTDPTDGAMTFWDPENGVTTANSNYPRSELREMTAAGAGANWPIAGTNTLSATVEVVKVPDHVCVGQIHIGSAIQAGLAASTKPLLELYYHASGDIQLGIEDSPTGGQTAHDIANVPLGTKFSYTIRLDGAGTITLVVDGATSTFTMPASFVGYGMYFKAGDYDQTVGTDGTVGATVKLHALQVSHGP